MNTTRESKQRASNRELTGLRANVNAFFRDCMQHAVAEGSRVQLYGFPKTNRVAAQAKSETESSRKSESPRAEFMPSCGPSDAGPGRKIVRRMLAASLILAALVGSFTLQAAIHVYVWRLAG